MTTIKLDEVDFRFIFKECEDSDCVRDVGCMWAELALKQFLNVKLNDSDNQKLNNLKQKAVTICLYGTLRFE